MEESPCRTNLGGIHGGERGLVIDVVSVFRRPEFFAKPGTMSSLGEFGFEPSNDPRALSRVGAFLFLGRHFPEGDLFQGLALGSRDRFIGKVGREVFQNNVSLCLRRVMAIETMIGNEVFELGIRGDGSTKEERESSGQSRSQMGFHGLG